MRKTLCVITAGIMMASALSGCSLASKLGFGNDESKPTSSVAISEQEAQNIANKMPLNLYFSTEDNSKLLLEVRYVEMTEGKKGTASLATVIVNELIKGPQVSGLKATIPQGAKLAAPVTLEAGTATVNFTKEFVDKHPGGEAQAKSTIYSIVNSITELTDVQRVKFLVNGKSVTDFKGAYKFDSPFPRTASLIGKSPNIGSAVTAAAKSTETTKQTTDTSKGAAATQATTSKTTTQDSKTTDSKAVAGQTQQSVTTKSTTTGAVAPTVTPKATPAPTPKKSSLVSPENGNVKSLSSELAYLEKLD